MNLEPSNADHDDMTLQQIDLTPFKSDKLEGSLPIFPGISIPYILPVAYPMAPGWFVPLLVALTLDVVSGPPPFANIPLWSVNTLTEWGNTNFAYVIDPTHSISLNVTIFSIIVKPLLFYGAQSHTTLYLVLTVFLAAWPALALLELLGVILGIALSMGPLLALTPVLVILELINGIVSILANVFTFILSLICMLIKGGEACTQIFSCLCSTA